MKPGTVVMERYVIEALAGVGGMGSVYRARDQDGAVVALKVLSEGRDVMDGRFQREARMLLELQHPGIVRSLNSGVTESGERFLAMEWLEGVDLGACLLAGPLSLDEALVLTGRMAEALGYAHVRGAIHRDVKPSNIFLPNGSVAAAKLLDFGVARWSSASSLTSTGMQLGTPSYMAPEQIRSDEQIEPAADVFSLGCVLYQCLSNEMAFPGRHPMAVFYKILVEDTPVITQVVQGVPASIANLLARMMDRRPDNRPQDGIVVAQEIADIRQRLAATRVPMVTAAVKSDAHAITADERQMLSVILVLAGDAGEAEIAQTSEFQMDGQVTDLFRGQRNTAELDEVLRLRARYESFGVHFESLGDGSLLAVLDSRRTAMDQAVDAARCALDLRAIFAHEPMAVATGRAVIGQRRLLSDIIDRAATLLDSHGRAGTREQFGVEVIGLDEVTAGLLDARFEVAARAAGPLLVRERSVARHLLLGRPTPLVGRKREMATMQATLEESAEEGAARVILVLGRAGAGKSRLRSEFWHSVNGQDDTPCLWQANGDAMRTGSPLDLMAQMIRFVADVHDGEPLALRQDKLAARVARSVPEFERRRVAGFLGELIDTRWPSDYAPLLRDARLSPRVMGEQIRRACLDLLTADLRQDPVLLLLDDLHWGDRASIEFLDQALGELRERPLVVIGLGRPESARRFPGLWTAHDLVTLSLRPLSNRAARQLIHSVLGAELTERSLQQMISRADGHALYLEELIRSAAAGRQEVPETVLAMMQSRLEELLPRPRRVLRAASIFGENFWPGGVAAVLGGDAGLDGHLRSLVADELIVAVSESRFAGEQGYRFRHDLVREAAHGLLTGDDRRLGHKLAAEWLVQAGESDPLVLAEHFHEGQAAAQSLPYLVRAAENACRAGDFDAALSLAARAEQSRASGQLLGAVRAVQADAHLWLTGLARAAEFGTRALALLPRGSHAWYEAAENTSWAEVRLGRVQVLVARTTELLGAPAASAASDGWLMLAAFLAKYLLLFGQLAPARRLLTAVEEQVARREDQLIDTAEPELDRAAPAVAARVHGMRAHRGLILESNPAVYLRGVERASACYQRAGDARRACLEQVNTGYARNELGLYGDAVAILRPALATAEALSLSYMVDTAKQNLGIALAYTGELEEAVVLAREAADSFERRGNPRMAAVSRSYLAVILMYAGNPQLAEREADRALDLSPAESPTMAMARAVLARVLLARNRQVSLERLAEKTLDDSAWYASQTDETVTDSSMGNAALTQAAEAKKLMRRLGGLDEGEAAVRLAFAEAMHEQSLEALAHKAIRRARERLHERAALIDRVDWRHSFLHEIPEHARTLRLAASWLEGS